MGILNYINGVRPFLVRLASHERVVFVVGNEASDLDSCVSSIVGAYLYTQALVAKPSSFAFHPDKVLPLINIPRKDLELRPDVVHLLQTTGIAPESLAFLDDLTAQSTASSYSFLVDFNKMTESLTGLFDSRVVGIIDHHDDENLYQSSLDSVKGPRVIAKAGSCISLVIDYWHRVFSEQIGSTAVLQDPVLAKLSLAPMLVDTSELRQRTEDIDRSSYKILDSVLKSEVSGASLDSSSFDQHSFYAALQKAKKNLDGMAPRDILRKDYKEWDGKAPSSGKSLRLGISSTVQSFDWLQSHHSGFFSSDLPAWARERQLQVAGVMATSKNHQGQFQRQLAVWSEDEDATRLVSQFATEFGSELGLSPLQHPEGSATLKLFQQSNTDASRKQVAPLMRKSLQGVALPAL